MIQPSWRIKLTRTPTHTNWLHVPECQVDTFRVESRKVNVLGVAEVEAASLHLQEACFCQGQSGGRVQGYLCSWSLQY